MPSLSFRRLRALVYKEFVQMSRDISSFLIGIVLPLILLLIYGFGVSLDINHLRIGLVKQDVSPDASRFWQSLVNSKYFEVIETQTVEESAKLLLASKIRGIVVIPPYFSEYLQREDTTAPIQVISDGSEPNTAAFVQNYVMGVFQTWLAQESINTGVSFTSAAVLIPRFWFNEELLSRNFLIPGSIAIIMTLIGTLLTALVVAREWERGTMEALLATPVKVFELLIGKLVPYFLLGLFSMSLCVFVAVVFYHVPLRGSYFTLALASSAFLFTAIQLGLLISIVSKNQFVASQVSIVSAFLPAFILSGFIFEISSMPLVIQWITHLIPARYFVSCLQTIFLVGNTWEVLLPNMAAILLFGVLVLLLTVKKLVKWMD